MIVFASFFNGFKRNIVTLLPTSCRFASVAVFSDELHKYKESCNSKTKLPKMPKLRNSAKRLLAVRCFVC